MDIGARIKQRRIELGMTQEELANKLGYTHKSTITKIETNANQLRQKKILAIANALDTTPAWIMGWDEETPEEKGEEDFALLDKIHRLNSANYSLLTNMIDTMLQSQSE